MSDEQELRDAMRFAYAALAQVEWTGSHRGTGYCLWCSGWERHPQMDEDYNGKAGHKPDCVRQRAMEMLRVELSK
jgi:hypothetical protein